MSNVSIVGTVFSFRYGLFFLFCMDSGDIYMKVGISGIKA